MGVYAPSPGTIYPRLARLEEEGLVTHDEADGRKVYRITDKGREEIQARLEDLADLEEEITASVRDIAREVTEDVRETVRSLREELTWAARDMHRNGPPPPRGARPPRGNSAPARGSGWADPGTYRDLEQLARRFSRELRDAAAQAQAVSEDAVGGPADDPGRRAGPDQGRGVRQAGRHPPGRPPPAPPAAGCPRETVSPRTATATGRPGGRPR